MRILLDTNIAIYSIIQSRRLSDELIDQLKNINNEVFVSIASIWEVAIKSKKNPNSIPIDEIKFAESCLKSDYAFLPISPKHIFEIRNLKTIDNNIIHKDPFDNIIVAQSIYEDLTLYTSDNMLKNYNVNKNIVIC